MLQGVFLRRNVVNVAGRALKVNLQRLGPLVLPVTEMVRLLWLAAWPALAHDMHGAARHRDGARLLWPAALASLRCFLHGLTLCWGRDPLCGEGFALTWLPEPMQG